jgi:hypothetical protein
MKKMVLTIYDVNDVHAELIKAWEDGAEIEFYNSSKYMWITIDHPSWDSAINYRVKPEPKIETTLTVRQLYEVWDITDTSSESMKGIANASLQEAVRCGQLLVNKDWKAFK